VGPLDGLLGPWKSPDPSSRMLLSVDTYCVLGTGPCWLHSSQWLLQLCG
jgi:hypothetical protein